MAQNNSRLTAALFVSVLVISFLAPKCWILSRDTTFLLEQYDSIAIENENMKKESGEMKSKLDEAIRNMEEAKSAKDKANEEVKKVNEEKDKMNRERNKANEEKDAANNKKNEIQKQLDDANAAAKTKEEEQSKKIADLEKELEAAKGAKPAEEKKEEEKKEEEKKEEAKPARRRLLWKVLRSS